MKGNVVGGWLSCLVAGALATFVAHGSAQADEWRLATLAPKGSGWMKVLDKAAEQTAKATENRVKFKYYSSGVQGDEKDVVRKMKMGGLDGAVVTSVGLGLIDPSIKVLELPMMFESPEELDYVRKKMWPTFRKRFAKKGFRLLHYGDVGFVYFYSNHAVKTKADLAKAKVWLWADDDIVSAMFKKIGVNGVPLGVPDVLPALTTGRINACYASPMAAAALQWHSKVRFSTSMPMSYGIGGSVVRLEAWDKLSDKDKKSLEKVDRKVGALMRKVARPRQCQSRQSHRSKWRQSHRHASRNGGDLRGQSTRGLGADGRQTVQPR